MDPSSASAALAACPRAVVAIITGLMFGIEIATVVWLYAWLVP